MPLNLSELWEKHRGYIEAGFWILIFAVAYIAMQKVMHPGWQFFGI